MGKVKETVKCSSCGKMVKKVYFRLTFPECEKEFGNSFAPIVMRGAGSRCDSKRHRKACLPCWEQHWSDWSIWLPAMMEG